MGRRRRNDYGPAEAIVILIAIIVGLYFIVWTLSALLAFITNNSWILYTLLGLFFVIAGAYLGVEYYKVKKYKETEYYNATGRPYNELKKPGVKFEATTYNRLKADFSRATFLVNVLLPKADSVNQYFEIDIVMFSAKGIILLELKDWKGFINGSLTSEKWDVGIKKTDGSRMVNKYYNPYKQNKYHIKELNKIVSYPYKGYVIFSEAGNIGGGFSNISHYDGFVKAYKNLPVEHVDTNEMNEIYRRLKKSIITEKIPDHIERVKYNQSKHERFTKRRG